MNSFFFLFINKIKIKYIEYFDYEKKILDFFPTMKRIIEYFSFVKKLLNIFFENSKNIEYFVYRCEKKN